MNPPPSAAARFRALHAPGQVLVLLNAWDAVSARIAEAAGGAAIATSSAAVAWAHGMADGERLPLDRLLAAVRDILRAVRVPVSVDLERGYAASAEGVADAVCRLAEAGAAGVNIEDGTEPPEALASRLLAARGALQRAGLDLFLNARTDVLLRRALSGAAALDDVVRRARRYIDAGCDGLFVPGLSTAEELLRVVAEVRVPLNVWASPALPPIEQLRTLGVRRVSVGPRLALTALSAARQDAAQILGGGWAPPSHGAPLSYAEVNGWFA
ncbi:isocitrate lyase/PEP mutase family protein [Sorangium sp. So ce1335]|uniref:isocitrate lyase/PEP mutase family protein n=1 Tax=Sorangium sp. So ce1335 TaxID=3133335 RepID=UPI003F5FC5C5